jgi:hypothetical protein
MPSRRVATVPQRISAGAPLAATFDQAGGDKDTQKCEIEQREHTKAGGQHEQQDGHEQASADILEQVTSSQPVVPLPATALGCWYSRGPGRGRAVGRRSDPRSGLGSRHEVSSFSFLGCGRRSCPRR